MTSNRASTIDSENSVTRHRLLVGLIAVMGSLVAHATAEQTMQLTMQPKKGYFVEKCFTLERGQQLAYQLSTRYPVEFNLHHHTSDGKTLFPDKLVVESQHSKQIVSESGGAYCFMATVTKDQPGGFDVVIKYQISGS